ncbi:MAG: helix-turn-helix domain-containing protein [Planctomycetia bacterium]|nr:helix-turn-helix domain-containing protein [Planctomycetia bacterium]
MRVSSECPEDRVPCAPEPESTVLAPAPLLTSADLERLFQVGSRTIRRWVDSAQLPRPVRVGGVRRWQLDDIRQVLHQLQAAASDA